MTMKDRKVLNDVLQGCYRMQARTDMIALRRAGKAGPPPPEAEEAPRKPLTPEEKRRYRFEERVKAGMKSGQSRPAAEATVLDVIYTKELPGDRTPQVLPADVQEPVTVFERAAAPVGALIRIDQLKTGQRFRCEIPNNKGGLSEVLHGALVYATAGRARVELDRVAEVRKFTTRTGEEIELNSASPKQTDWAPEVEVFVEPGFKDFALQNSRSKVSSNMKSKSIQDQTEEIMAAAKKASKKKAAAENGNGTARKHTSYDGMVFSVDTKKINEKLQSQLANPEKNSHGVVVLRTISAGKKALTLAEVIERVKASKQYKTEGNPDGLITGDVRILMEKGILVGKGA